MDRTWVPIRVQHQHHLIADRLPDLVAQPDVVVGDTVGVYLDRREPHLLRFQDDFEVALVADVAQGGRVGRHLFSHCHTRSKLEVGAFSIIELDNYWLDTATTDIIAGPLP